MTHATSTPPATTTTQKEDIAVTDMIQALSPVADHWDWQYDGLCRTMSPELFFHPEGERGSTRRRRVEAAKAICAECPVLTQCRQQALACREPYGIWGGMSEEEREAYHLARRTKTDVVPETFVA